MGDNVIASEPSKGQWWGNIKKLSLKFMRSLVNESEAPIEGTQVALTHLFLQALGNLDQAQFPARVTSCFLIHVLCLCSRSPCMLSNLCLVWIFLCNFVSLQTSNR